MSNLTDAEYCKELGEEELNKITGGAGEDEFYMQKGTWAMNCPFCGKPFTINFGSDQKKIPGDLMGTCPNPGCSATIYYKSISFATYKKNCASSDAHMDHSF